MTPEEHKAHRRPINRESQRRYRKRNKERQRRLEELEGGSAIMSPSQRKEAMLGKYADIFEVMVHGYTDYADTLNREEARDDRDADCDSESDHEYM